MLAGDKGVALAGKGQMDSGAPIERPEHSELFTIIHELSRLVSVYFDAAVAPHNLTHAQWWALMHIAEREGATQIELAAYMQMGRAAAGKLFERLESHGLIERRPDEHDGRLRRIYLRQDASPLLTAMQHEGKGLFEVFLKDVSPEEERTLLSGLRKIKRNSERS